MGIWIMNVSIGNWGANKLSYKILDKIIEILEKTNNKLHCISCGNLARSISNIGAKKLYNHFNSTKTQKMLLQQWM